jgi:hypothetical protein
MSGINIFEQKDFTGGLNLRSDQFQLADNESPKMLNVEIDPRGGVFSRGGMQRINSTAVTGTWDPQKLYSFSGDGTTPYVMLTNGNNVLKSTGGNFTTLQYSAGNNVTGNSPHGVCLASWGNTLYIATGTASTGGGYSWKTSDTYATNIQRSGYNPDPWQTTADPTYVKMPQCEHIIVHASRMWAAQTTEPPKGSPTSPATTYPNRLRYSITGTATNWNADAYFDFLGGGDGITGMAIANGSLVVFKPHAVYIVYGNDPTNFGVLQLSDKLGCQSHHAMAIADNGVYFYSLGRGLFFCDGNSIIEISKNIKSIIDLGYVSSSSTEGVSVSWVGGRVWLSLPYAESGAIPVYPTVNFVFDPTLAAFTMFQTADNRGVVAGCDFRNSTNTEYRLMIHPTEPYVLNVDRYSEETDTITTTGQGFTSYYRTKWFDGGSYMQKKMFRRPDVVLKESDTNQSVNVKVWHNFDEADTNWVREFTLDQTIPTSGTWNLALWGSGIWGVGAASSVIRTGKNLGLAKTVQLQFTGPSGQAWGINSIGYKFNSRRVGG